MSVQIPQFTEDVNIIAGLPDQPTITSAELKAKFDEASVKIKNYINNILIAGIDGWGEDLKETLQNNLQDALDEIQALIDNLSAEDVAYDNTTSELTATDVQHAIDEIVSSLNSVTNTVNANLDKKTVYGDFAVTTEGKYDSLPKTTPGSQDYTFTITANKSNYYPIGIIGFNYVKSNVNAELLRYGITSRSNGRAVITYRIRLNNTVDNTGHTLYFDILWVRVR